MGLYLCILNEGGEDRDGVDVGYYDDYGFFVDTVISALEGGRKGERFPTLTLHHDSDGVWTPEECRALEAELETIKDEFQAMPPKELNSGWQREIAKLIGLTPKNLYECFIDVDGEPLLDRLIDLCKTAEKMGCSIVFQ